MCRIHRLYCSFTAAVWVGVFYLSFFARPEEGGMHTGMILLGCLGVVLLPYCLFPYLMRDMMRAELRDTTALFLAGWEARQEFMDDPKDPTAAPLKRVA